MIDKEAIEKMTAIREYRIKKGIAAFVRRRSGSGFFLLLVQLTQFFNNLPLQRGSHYGDHAGDQHRKCGKVPECSAGGAVCNPGQSGRRRQRCGLPPPDESGGNL